MDTSLMHLDPIDPTEQLMHPTTTTPRGIGTVHFLQANDLMQLEMMVQAVIDLKSAEGFTVGSVVLTILPESEYGSTHYYATVTILA